MAHLRLVCDHHITRDTVDWLKNSPGRHKVTPTYEKGWETLADELLILRAKRDRRVIVTEDNGFSSSAKYRICTHAGIIVIRGHNRTRAERREMLGKFLQSGYRDRCKHAIVVLTATKIRIEDLDGVEEVPL